MRTIQALAVPVADRPLLNANDQALAVPSPDRPLLNANGQALAVPAPIGSNGSSFTVTRTSVPATTGRQPAGPASRRPPAPGR
jgi:hypothetical protein